MYLAILMSFYSVTKISLISPLNLMKRFTLEQRKSFHFFLFILVGTLTSKIGVFGPIRGLTEANLPITSDCLVRLIKRRHNRTKWGRCNHLRSMEIPLYHDNRFFAPVPYGIDLYCCYRMLQLPTYSMPQSSYCVKRLINRNVHVNWRPKWCDLTPLNHFLWAIFREKSYAVEPETTQHLKANEKVHINIDPIKWGIVIAHVGSHMNEIIYDGCLLYLGIREQKQILIIENRFVVFQNILH